MAFIQLLVHTKVLVFETDVQNQKGKKPSADSDSLFFLQL